MSALSPGVKRLITQTGISRTCSNKEEVPYFISQDGLINWDIVADMLPNVPDYKDDTMYFEEAVSALAPLFLQSENFLSILSTEEFRDKLSPFISWTGIMKVVLDCFTMLHSPRGSDVDFLLVTLMVTSTLERALGDVYLTQGTKCPSMLKDLLQTPELGRIFGPTIMKTIRVVMGPPTSLNIRNVVWHGFPAPGEIPHRYTWFLLLLVPSLGRVLGTLEEIRHRPFTEFPQTSVYQQHVKDFKTTDRLEITKVFEQSTIVPEWSMPVWSAAVDMYYNGRYGHCAMLLLPQLEHAMRLLFSSVNNCPHRACTAEATTLYTTFDEILDPWLDTGQENCVAAVVGEEYMDLLLDLLEYPSGPRVRDRLSHGEVDVDTFPKTLTTVILGVALCITAKFLPKNKLESAHISPMGNKFVCDYESLFHPVSMVKQKIKTVVDKAATLNNQIHYTLQLEPRSSFHYTELCRAEHPLLVALTTDIEGRVSDICATWHSCCCTPEQVSRGMLKPMEDGSRFVLSMLTKKIRTLYRFNRTQHVSGYQGTQSKDEEHSCDTGIMGNEPMGDNTTKGHMGYTLSTEDRHFDNTPSERDRDMDDIPTMGERHMDKTPSTGNRHLGDTLTNENSHSYDMPKKADRLVNVTTANTDLLMANVSIKHLDIGKVTKINESKVTLDETIRSSQEITPISDRSSIANATKTTVVNGLVSSLISTVKPSFDEIKPALTKTNLVGGGQSEIVGLLQRVLIECEVVVTQLETAVESRQILWENGQLRPRQQDSLQKLITSCPCLHKTLHFLVVLVLWQLYTLDTMVTTKDGKRRIRYLKNVLQFAEKLRVYTGPDKNRWTEAVELSLGFLGKVKNFVCQTQL